MAKKRYVIVDADGYFRGSLGEPTFAGLLPGEEIFPASPELAELIRINGNADVAIRDGVAVPNPKSRQMMDGVAPGD